MDTMITKTLAVTRNGTNVNLGFMNLNGKRYIVPHWIEVDESVTYDNILEYVPEEKLPEAPKVETFHVVGKPYLITVVNDKASCSCPGFTFHKRCKHIVAFNESRQ